MVASALAERITHLTSAIDLSFDEIGGIVEASARSVSRWSNGEVVPQKLNRQRLIELAYVADAVTAVLPREQANLWMFTPVPMLGHDTPADRIRQGGYRDVLAVIAAVEDGIVA